MVTIESLILRLKEYPQHFQIASCDIRFADYTIKYPENKRICRMCSREMPSTANFCGQCGTKIAEE